MKAEQNIQRPVQVGLVQAPENLEGGLDLGQFFAALRRKMLLILGVTAAVTGAAALKAITDTPIYNGRLEVLVQFTTAEAEVISSVPGTLTSEQPTTAKPQPVSPDLLRILSSPKLIVPVFQKLKAQYPELCDTPTPASAVDTPTASSSPSPATSPPPTPASTSNSIDSTSNDTCYKSIVRNLKVSVVGEDSNIIQVTYQGASAEEVQTFLQYISEAYLKYSLDSRQININRAIKFVDAKLPDLRARVTNLQAQLLQLRVNNNLIDPESRGQQLAGQVEQFSQQQIEAQIELEQTQALYADLRSQLAQSTESAASSALSENPRYQAVLNKLLELDAEISKTSSIFLNTTPDMQVLLEQRQKLVDLLAREGTQAQKEVLKKLQALELRQRSLQTTLNNLNSGVRDLSGISREYTDIQRELEIATETLNQFISKQQALQIEAAQREVPWEILTPPTEPQPIASSLSQNLILGAILGLLLGVGIALAFDRLTEVIYTPEELKRLVKMPILGTIPYNENLVHPGQRSSLLAALGRGQAAVGQTPRLTPLLESDTFSEAFRTLYTNTRLLNSDDPVRSLVISSTAPAEGKTTVAAYLAQAAAAMDQRVLLVDTDLRFPRLHDYLNLSNDYGLVNVLSEDLPFADVLQKSPVEPNLYILTAGSIPPDPTRSLSSQKMQRLMEQVQKQFDLVIYDAPPLLGYADAFLVAAQTNGVILVAELGKLKRSLLEQLLEQLRISSTSVLGVVVQKA
jgi:capsular exopolysaccharide synthesis family protein